VIAPQGQPIPLLLATDLELRPSDAPQAKAYATKRDRHRLKPMLPGEIAADLELRPADAPQAKAYATRRN